MNRKQKMVFKMWKNYSNNCKMQDTKPLNNYNVFRNVYMTENFKFLYLIKNWYRDIRI